MNKLIFSIIIAYDISILDNTRIENTGYRKLKIIFEQYHQLPTHEKRFGNIAIDKGFITLQQLIDAINVQVLEEIKDGKHRLIGQILFDLNYMTTEQIQIIIDQIQEDSGVLTKD